MMLNKWLSLTIYLGLITFWLLLQSFSPVIHAQDIEKSIYIATPQQASSFYLQPAQNIVFHNNQAKMIVTIGIDGKLTYGPDYKPDEAARQFWEAISHYAPKAPCQNK